MADNEKQDEPEQKYVPKMTKAQEAKQAKLSKFQEALYDELEVYASEVRQRDGDGNVVYADLDDDVLKEKVEEYEQEVLARFYKLEKDYFAKVLGDENADEDAIAALRSTYQNMISRVVGDLKAVLKKPTRQARQVFQIQSDAAGEDYAAEVGTMAVSRENRPEALEEARKALQIHREETQEHSAAGKNLEALVNKNHRFAQAGA